ncbi:MAG: hypothetical protein AAF616_16415 [Bacteroidota bacterium]
MKAASLADIKRELKECNHQEVMAICLRLGRFKKENKELLTYLLFEAKDEASYVRLLKEEIDDQLDELNTTHLYFIKKGLQKIVRSLNRYLRYSANKQTEVEVRMYFCESIRKEGIAIHRHSTIENLYYREISRIEKALLKLHEDLQADYQFEVEKLK